jgi:type VI secretion system protein VasG
MGLCQDPELIPEPEEIAKALRGPLLKVFPPALLGRLIVIPYYPLSDAVMGDIIRLQLGRIATRIAAHHKVPFTWDDKVVDLIASRCTEPESGGRMIDAILTNTMLPSISAAFLERLLEGEAVTAVKVGVEGGEFSYTFE